MCSYRTLHPISVLPCFPAWRPHWASPLCRRRPQGLEPTCNAGALVLRRVERIGEGL